MDSIVTKHVIFFSWLLQILALLADALVEIQEQVMENEEVVNCFSFPSLFQLYSHNITLKALDHFVLQDDDWEEVEGDEDAEADKDLLYSSFTKPSHKHLEAMAKVFDEVSSTYFISSLPLWLLSFCWFY